MIFNYFIAKNVRNSVSTHLFFMSTFWSTYFWKVSQTGPSLGFEKGGFERPNPTAGGLGAAQGPQKLRLIWWILAHSGLFSIGIHTVYLEYPLQLSEKKFIKKALWVKFFGLESNRKMNVNFPKLIHFVQLYVAIRMWLYAPIYTCTVSSECFSEQYCILKMCFGVIIYQNSMDCALFQIKKYSA